ncbi:sensor histidine kinase [Cumulibacter soli]|uniref:sensor histidine kinase n=1 Tax=Cumulibacter soli TaxID=2546344 RepID=UPI0010686819|nr:HAMP domain-containing sensor histidine kinase [Cumulibacter soli]
MSSGTRRWRDGLRARLAGTIVLVVLLTSGGTALSVYLTLSFWLTKNATTTASYIFRSEMEDLADSNPAALTQSELSRLVEPDVTLVLDGDLVVQGSVSGAEIHRPGASPSGTEIGPVQIEVHGHRVTMSVAVPMTSATGEQATVVAYVDRTLPGIKSGIITLGTVTGISIVVALAIAFAGAWWLGGRLITPLRQLNAAASRSSAGQFDAELPEARITEVADLAEGFNQMQRAHTASLARREQFVSDVSHELRTPLAAMIPVVEILEEERGAMSPDAREAADILSAEVHSLASLVEDLIEISRHDAQRVRFVPEHFDVRALVGSVVATRGWGASVEVQSEEPQVWAYADPRRLEIAVSNLVANAHRHGSPPVRVDIARIDGDLVIRVSDHGPGVPAEARSSIFERFVKADTARTRGDGSGLGLSLARANIAIHGGTIEVTSLREPTTFTIRIPRAAETRSR